MKQIKHLLQVVATNNGFHLDSASFIKSSLEANDVIVTDLFAKNTDDLAKRLLTYSLPDYSAVILHEPSNVSDRQYLYELLGKDVPMVGIVHDQCTDGEEALDTRWLRIASAPAFRQYTEMWLPLYGGKVRRGRFPATETIVIASGSLQADKYAAQLIDALGALNVTNDVVHFGLQDEEEIAGGRGRLSEVVDRLCRAKLLVCTDDRLGSSALAYYALHADIPIIALESGGISEILGCGGMILRNCEPEETALYVSVSAADPVIRTKIRAGQRERLNAGYRETVVGQKLLRMLGWQDSGDDFDISPPPVRSATFVVEGPFDSSYSLAIVNRSLARALRHYHIDVKIGVSPAEGDYRGPSKAFEVAHADVMEMWERRNDDSPDVVMRNTYPPITDEMRGLYNLYHCYAWEESAYPTNYLRSFNSSLNLLTSVSAFVTKTLIDNGLTVPLVTVGNGVSICKDPSVPPPVSVDAGFVFLHVSSCFPRKGVDLLLEAFAAAFDGEDDVCLVIKTFPNIHNDIDEKLRHLHAFHQNVPGIIVINEDLAEEPLAALYRRSDVVVAPSRGEGFGLPLAEAFLHGKPVIATGFGGQMDFISAENSWLVDYRFERAQSHMDLYDSVWVEPDVNDLARNMRKAFETPAETRAAMAASGKRRIESRYTWDVVAKATCSAVEAVKSKEPVKGLRVAWLSTWNAKCGIATYSAFLLQGWPTDTFHVFARVEAETTAADDNRVTRCWYPGAVDISVLMDKVKGFDCLVIQYHPAFFDVQILAQICAVCEKDQVPLYVFIHNTGFLRPFSHEPAHVKVVSRLNKARRIFVHSVYELNNLKTFGLVDNVTLFPHGATKGDKISPICDTSGKVTIASYGFFLKHKGLFELIEALGSIRRRYDVQLLLVNALHPEGRSVEFYQQCRDLIASLDMEEHVRLVPDFLPDAESLQHLMAADIIVFPYQYSDEGASGAVRFGLRADRLVACSPLPIFDDIADAVQMLPGTSPAQIAAGIIRLIDKKKSWPEMLERQRNWLEAHSWAKLSKRLSQVIFADLQWLRWGSKHSLQ